MRKTTITFLALLCTVLFCLPIISTVVAADDGQEAEYVFELKATNSPKITRSDMLSVFGDSLLSSASYGLEAEGDAETFKEVTLLSSYNIPASGFYTAYKTTKKTGSGLNKKPDWTQATTKRIEVKFYYTATCSVTGHEDGELYLNGEAVHGSVKLYENSEYVFTAKTIDEYVYTITGADDGVAFTPTADLQVTASYIKAAFATVDLNVEGSGTVKIISGGKTVLGGKVPEGNGFSIEVTPDTKNGYYLDSITIEKDGEPYEGTEVAAVADGEYYEVTVIFARALIELSDVGVNYIDIEKGNYDLIEQSIISQVSLAPPEFEDGAVYKVEYLAGHIIVDIYEDLDYEVPILLMLSNHKFGYSGESGELEMGNTETIRVTCENPNFPGIKLVTTVTATVVDLRIPTEISSSSITITYGDDLKPVVLGAITIKGEDGATIDFDESQITVDPETPSVKLLQFQDVEVSFSGNDEYAPSVGTISVYVRQADSSLDVKSEKITYGETPAIEVITDPEDLDYILLIAGIDGDATGFISIYIPQSVQELMKIDLGLFSIDFYDILRTQMEDGISFGELKNLIASFSDLVNSDGVEDISQYTSFNIESIQTILNILSSLPTIDINAKVTLGNPPKNAGIYLVGAVTATFNYKFNADIAYLAILPKMNTEDEPVYLSFANDMGDHNFLTYEAAQDFGFGGTLEVGGSAVEIGQLRTSYFGVTFGGETVAPIDTPIREPGIYTETIYVLGGNYLVTPIARVYMVGRIPTGIEAPEKVTVYDGTPQEMDFSVAANGIDPDKVYTIYSGNNYISTTAPVNAGTYTVYIIYIGDDLYQTTLEISTLTIEKAPIVVDVYCAESVVYGMLDGTDTANQAELSVVVTGLPNNEALDVTPYIVETEAFPHVGTYTVHALFVPNANYDVTVNDAVLTIVPRPVEIVFDNATKIYGDENPSFTYKINDLGAVTDAFRYGESRENARIADIIVKTDAKTDSAVGTYEIHAESEVSSTDDYEVKASRGVLTVVPREATVTIENKTIFFGDDDPEFTYIAEGVLEGDDLMITFTREAGENTGTYAISAKAGNGNYAVTFVGENGETGVFTIEAMALFVKIYNVTKQEGTRDAGFSVTVENQSGKPIDPESIGLTLNKVEGGKIEEYAVTVALAEGDYSLYVQAVIDGEVITEVPADFDWEAALNTHSCVAGIGFGNMFALALFAAGALIKKRKR